MLYNNIQFPTLPDRPYFYSNFVSTIDGKVMVKSVPRGYWPIGSATDTMLVNSLRAQADALVHGTKTAMWYRTLDKIHKPEFQKKRSALHKSEKLAYFVVSNNPPGELADYLEKSENNKPFLVTTEDALIPDALKNIATILRFGQKKVNLTELAAWQYNNGFKHVLLEGGPILLGAFFAANLVDEIFLTIAPKIFGNKNNNTMTMVEGYLLPHTKIKRCQLLSVESIENEVFLRYKVVSPIS